MLALVEAEKGSEFPDELGLATWSMVELIEAAARTGQAERATGALERLSEATHASGTDWALGVEARSRALLDDGGRAERLYQEAIERLGRTRTASTLPALISCMGSGYAVRTAGWTHVNNFGPLTRC